MVVRGRGVTRVARAHARTHTRKQESPPFLQPPVNPHADVHVCVCGEGS